MQEVWKDIEGFAGYQVSNLGRVRTYNKVTHSTLWNCDRHWKDRILRQKTNRYGRCLVDLWVDGKAHTLSVHRLVAKAFVDGCADGLTVNHKDGKPSNNYADNLEWITLQDNILHGFKNGLYSTQKKCTLIDNDGNEYEFISYSEASRFLGRNHGYIHNALKHNRLAKSIEGNLYKIKLESE
jgi:hypothetical protein